MVQCQNCGQANAEESQFCRFCGTRISRPQNAAVPNNYDLQAPRPYAWKTDEFQTRSDVRRTSNFKDARTQNYLQFPGQHADAGSTLAGRNVNFLDPNYRCPNCRSQFQPKTERRISTAGWITFAVLLVTVFPLFWIGLLIKEDVHVCPSCNSNLGK